MHRRGVCVRDEATAATGFIHAGPAHGDALFRFKGALRVVRRLAAPHTNGVGLRLMYSAIASSCGHELQGLPV